MNSRDLYWALVVKFADTGIITKRQARIIARVNTRKERYYKRHILDLCEFVLWKMDDIGLQNNDITGLCNSTIQLIKKGEL